jgi:antitoxin component YwqK of YwqJK toxin-antitoxin module
MKKVIAPIILSSVLSGCTDTEVDQNLVQIRGGIAYLPNESEPFSGKAGVYYPSGQQQLDVSYQDGLLSGKKLERYLNGQLKGEQIFEVGGSSGIHKLWYSNGQLKNEQHYSGGDVGRIRDWYENGEVSRDIRIVDGIFVGKNIWSPSKYGTELNVLDGINRKTTYSVTVE